VEYFLAMIENETFRQDLFEVQLEQYRRSQEWLRNLAQSGQLLDLEQFAGESSASCDRRQRLNFCADPFTGEGEKFTGYVIVKAEDFNAALEIANNGNTSSTIEFRVLRIVLQPRASELSIIRNLEQQIGSSRV
jgi:hypothetical protein